MIDKNTIHQEMVKEFDEEQNLSGEGIEYQGQLYWPNGAQRSVGGDFMVGPMSPKSIDYQQLPNRYRELRLRSYTQKFNNLRSWMKAKLEQIHRARSGRRSIRKRWPTCSNAGHVSKCCNRKSTRHVRRSKTPSPRSIRRRPLKGGPTTRTARFNKYTT